MLFIPWSGSSRLLKKNSSSVTPAEAGVQKSQERLDSRLRGNDIKDLKNRFFSSLLDRSEEGMHSPMVLLRFEEFP
jgi:hypothetical protein